MNNKQRIKNHLKSIASTVTNYKNQDLFWIVGGILAIYSIGSDIDFFDDDVPSYLAGMLTIGMFSNFFSNLGASIDHHFVAKSPLYYLGRYFKFNDKEQEKIDLDPKSNKPSKTRRQRVAQANHRDMGWVIGPWIGGVSLACGIDLFTQAPKWLGIPLQLGMFSNLFSYAGGFIDRSISSKTVFSFLKQQTEENGNQDRTLDLNVSNDIKLESSPV